MLLDVERLTMFRKTKSSDYSELLFWLAYFLFFAASSRSKSFLFPAFSNPSGS